MVDPAEHDRIARECGYELLEASVGYEGHTLPIEEYGNVVVLALVGRARRLLRAAFLLSNAGLGLEAAGVRRTLIEYVLTIRWLLTNSGTNLKIWQRDDAWMRIVGDDEVIKAGELGRMAEQMRARTEQLVTALDAELVALGVTERRVPSVKVLSEPDMALAYAAYRIDSQTGIHPRVWAAEQLLSVDRGAGTVTIHGEPVVRDEQRQVDPYGVCAYSLLQVLDMAAHVFAEELVDRSALDGVRARLDALVGLPSSDGA